MSFWKEVFWSFPFNILSDKYLRDRDDNVKKIKILIADVK